MRPRRPLTPRTGPRCAPHSMSSVTGAPTGGMDGGGPSSDTDPRGPTGPTVRLRACDPRCPSEGRPGQPVSGLCSHTRIILGPKILRPVGPCGLWAASAAVALSSSRCPCCGLALDCAGGQGSWAAARGQSVTPTVGAVHTQEAQRPPVHPGSCWTCGQGGSVMGPAGREWAFETAQCPRLQASWAGLPSEWRWPSHGGVLWGRTGRPPLLASPHRAFCLSWPRPLHPPTSPTVVPPPLSG